MQLTKLQQDILDYITGIIKTNNMPVIIPYYIIAEKFNKSEMTIKRHIDMLDMGNYIYRDFIGNSSIYDIKPIDYTFFEKDQKCLIKNTP